jgi:hypothetical protein
VQAVRWQARLQLGAEFSNRTTECIDKLAHFDSTSLEFSELRSLTSE